MAQNLNIQCNSDFILFSSYQSASMDLSTLKSFKTHSCPRPFPFPQILLEPRSPSVQYYFTADKRNWAG